MDLWPQNHSTINKGDPRPDQPSKTIQYSLLAAILCYRTRLLSSVTILLIEVNRGLIDFSHWLQRDNIVAWCGVWNCSNVRPVGGLCFGCLWDVFITLSNGHDHRGQNREKPMAQHMWVCLTLSFLLFFNETTKMVNIWRLYREVFYWCSWNVIVVYS